MNPKLLGQLDLDNVDAQFCSDWLKDEIRRVLKERGTALDIIRRLLYLIPASFNSESCWGCSMHSSQPAFGHDDECAMVKAEELVRRETRC